MPTVIVYRRVILPTSETFIKAQINAYQKWRAILVGRQLRHELPLDGLDARVIDPIRSNRLSHNWFMLKRLLNWLPNISSLQKENADLVHAHFGIDAVEAAPIADKLGLPLVVTLHGFDINITPESWKSGSGGLLMRGYPGQLLRLAAKPNVHFIAVSNSIKSRAVALGIAADKISVKHIGVDTEGFSPGPIPIVRRARRVLFVGRLVEKKGPEFLLRAIDIVRRSVPDVELTVVGDGPLRRSLEELARRLSIKANFLGARTAEEVRSELDQARVFCLPSITARNGDAEGLPIVLLEAQAKGVPVVTSAGGPEPEGIQQGRTGFAFSEGDFVDMAEKLSRILMDDELALRMALAGPAFVKNDFDIRQCTLRLERLYDEVSSKHFASEKQSIQQQTH